MTTIPKVPTSPSILLLKREPRENEPSENGLEEDETALLGTEEDALFGAEELMGMATLGSGEVVIKTEDEEVLGMQGVELHNDVAEQVNGDAQMNGDVHVDDDVQMSADVQMSEDLQVQNGELLSQLRPKVIDANTGFPEEDLLTNHLFGDNR